MLSRQCCTSSLQPLAAQLVPWLIDDFRKSMGLHSVRAFEHRSMPAGVAQSRHAFVGDTVSMWVR